MDISAHCNILEFITSILWLVCGISLPCHFLNQQNFAYGVHSIQSVIIHRAMNADYIYPKISLTTRKF